MTRYLTLAEAAEQGRCSLKTIKRRVADGTLPSVMGLGGKRLVRAADLPSIDFPRTHRTPPVRVREGGKGRLTQLVEEMEA